MPAAAVPPALARPARDVLDDLRRAFGDGVVVWARSGDGWRTVLGDGAGAPAPSGGAAEVPGTGYRLEIPGAAPELAGGAARFLASTLARVTRHDDEIRSFSREISERYEEINLLYSISEILGSIISLEQAAGTILAEVASILGASRAALWVHDAESHRLNLAAVEGGDGHQGPIPVDDPCSVTAAVFRDARPVILAPGEIYARGECAEIVEPQQGAF